MKSLKSLALVLVFVFCASFVYADNFDDYYKTGIMKVRELELKSGMCYSALDAEWKTIFTKPMYTYKGFSIEAGYDIEDMLIGAVTYKLLSLKEDLGVNFFLLDMVEASIGPYGGWKRIAAFEGTGGNNEWDWGVIFSVIKKKF